MLDEPTLSEFLAERWGVLATDVRSHHGGMNSATWFVRDGGTTWVAKAVPSVRATRFEAGLAVASRVEAGGIPAGAPVPTADDRRFVVAAGAMSLALLRYVDGRELTGRTEPEQRLMGQTLGRAHRALDGVTVPGAESFHWIDPDAAHLTSRPFVRDGVIAALTDWDRIPPRSLTWGLVHSDPAPEAFRYDASRGVCGLIDWDFGLVAPWMYDVASAVMYLGGRERAAAFVDAYLATGALPPDEVARTLRPMLHVRWAVQADYFSRRLEDDDRTGIADPAENEEGLEDALRGLASYADE